MADTAPARLSRLLALVPWLMAHDGILMTEAAEHFQVTPEQLEADLYLLIVSGLPGYGPDQLVDIQFWDDARIHVLDPQTIGRPLRLSGEEATALLVALRLLGEVPGDHDRGALTRTLAKLEQAVGDVQDVLIEPQGDPTIRAEVELALGRGCALAMVYGAGSGVLSERVVEPIAVSSLDGRTRIEAYCRAAGAVRTFRLDRIHRAQALLADPVHPLPAAVVPAEDSGLTSAEVVIDADAAWAADVFGLTSVTVTEDGLRGTVPVRDEDWLVRTVLALGGVAEVVAPGELRQAVADAAARAGRAYA